MISIVRRLLFNFLYTWHTHPPPKKKQKNYVNRKKQTIMINIKKKTA